MVHQERRQAAVPLGHGVVGGLIGIRTVGAEAGDGTVDEARIELAHRLVRDPETAGHAGAEVFHQDIGGLDQFVERRAFAARLQVEDDAALAVVVGQEHLARLSLFGPGAERVAVGGRFHLDHIGPHFGEQRSGIRAGDVLTEIEHPQACQWPHFVSLHLDPS
ncbi:MAG: hypothetical protein HYU75_20470 [Betaproteobacteria bacterium]|nr:hypothetical protein [Betaproteobacteria bacterium]